VKRSKTLRRRFIEGVAFALALLTAAFVSYNEIRRHSQEGRALLLAAGLPVSSILDAPVGQMEGRGRGAAGLRAAAKLDPAAIPAIEQAAPGDGIPLARSGEKDDKTIRDAGVPDAGVEEFHDRGAFSRAAPAQGDGVDRKAAPSDRPLEPHEANRGHRLTLLQLGDSHTAADFFTGRVRERLQEAFGDGGRADIVPGKPHLGVRSALFESEASDGWTYEALQKSGDPNRLYLSGFNAVTHRAGATLDLKARGSESFETVNVAFLTAPGGGKAEILVDGKSAGQVDLNGPANVRTVLRGSPPDSGDGKFHEVAVRSLSDGPVAVTNIEVGRPGDGVSYISFGFPGATVQLLDRLSSRNLADDLSRIAPDVIVLAFGTNEGYDDSLNVAAYIAQYEKIVARIKQLRPGVRIVMIGPPDGARAGTLIHAVSTGGDGDSCRFPTPPKLGAVREAQRALAVRVGASFWDWSSVMPAHCGAQIWAAASPPLMARDYVHMTLDGYNRSADRFADYLIPLISQAWTATRVVSNY
jgi:lysophospholipase L1-like esterase